VLLTALLFDVCFLSASADQEPEIYGKNALCINMESGKIFYEKNAGKTIAPASFTKIMTAVLALEYQEQYAPYTITVTNRALSGTVGNKIGFKEGEILAYEDLLAALIIANSNDAAHILAEEISGSIPAFVIKMNQKAKELGMVNTHFTNPSGVDESGMETTLWDMAVLAKHAYTFQEYQQLSTMSSYTILPTEKTKKGYKLINNNKLVINDVMVGYYVKGAVGLNAGGTEKAGYCCISTLQYNGLTTVALVSGSTYISPTYMHFKDIMALFNYANNNYSEITVVKAGTIIREIPVKQGKDTDHVIVVTEKNIGGLLPVDVNTKTNLVSEINLNAETLTAPIKQGTVVGTYTVTYNGEVLGHVNLITQSAVERSLWLFILAIIKDILSTGWVKGVLLGSFILFFLYAGTIIVFALFGKQIREKRKEWLRFKSLPADEQVREKERQRKEKDDRKRKKKKNVLPPDSHKPPPLSFSKPVKKKKKPSPQNSDLLGNRQK
jgi:D-alanyl-D-alanine carboxypeptidase